MAVVGWNPDLAKRNTDGLSKFIAKLKAKEEEKQAARRASFASRPAGEHPALDDRYANKALNNEIEAIRTTPAGGRNKQLNKSTYYLGQLVAGGLLNEDEVASVMKEAGEGVGLTPAEVQKTVRSGMRKGKEKPRTRPETDWERAARQVEATGGDDVPGQQESVNETREPFPVECFPEPIQRYVVEVARSLSCPEDFPAVAVLAIAATAIGASKAISITRKWAECARMYLAVVAVPGSAKSPAVDQVSEPMCDRQSELHGEWETERDRYDEAMVHWELAKRKKAGENAAPVAKPVKPTYKHLYTTDATIESLVPMLKENPKGFMLIKDEITGWVKSMDQYRSGKGADRQFWLSAWGGQAVKTDRKGTREEGSLIARHPFLNVFGGIQPDMLSELCDERGREDGFVHRILFSFPADQTWSEAIGEPPSEEAETAWANALRKLWVMEMHGEDNLKRPFVVQMNHEAKKAAADWYKKHTHERNADDFPPGLSGPWSKMRSYYFRVALVLHLLRVACGEQINPDEVDEISMVAADAVMRYFKSHARIVYERLYHLKDDRLAERALAWIKTRPGQECNARDMMRSSLTKRASESLELMRDLVDRGWGRIETREVGNNKQKADYFVLRRGGEE
jgi:hypothetical protein